MGTRHYLEERRKSEIPSLYIGLQTLSYRAEQEAENLQQPEKS